MRRRATWTRRRSAPGALVHSVHSAHIQDIIDALKGEVTVVIIAHRLSTVKNATGSMCSTRDG